MYFFKSKRFLVIFTSMIFVTGSGTILYVFHNDNQTLSENDIRSRLEQMYDAEVDGVTMNPDVYKAVIKKSGVAYLVEMNPDTGDVNSLEQTDVINIIKRNDSTQKVISRVEPNDVREVSEDPLDKNEENIESIVKSEAVKPPTKTIFSKSPISTIRETVENNNTVSMETSIKSAVKSVVIKEEKQVEKPLNTIINNAIKEVLQPEQMRIETIKSENSKEKTKEEIIEKPKEDKLKEEKPKEEKNKEVVSKDEESKKVTIKQEIAKSESSKSKDEPITEKAIKEEKKADDLSVKATNTVTEQTEKKKSEVSVKSEKVATVLITEAEAIKIAQQKYKGTVESNSFIKTDEGGYYLIVMIGPEVESDSKEGEKAKQTKATIQVHAISGKIISVTLE